MESTNLWQIVLQEQYNGAKIVFQQMVLECQGIHIQKKKMSLDTEFALFIIIN